MDDFRRYLASLVGSWELAASPHPDAVVVRGEGFVAARFPYPVLNNAVLTDPSALGAIRTLYTSAVYAVWTELADRRLADLMQAAGFRRDVTTRCCATWLTSNWTMSILARCSQMSIRTASPN